MAILAFISKFFVVVRIRMELEVRSHFLLLESLFLLQLVSFTVDSDPLYTDGVCEQNTLTQRIFLAHTSSLRTQHGPRCRTTCLHKRALIRMSSCVSPCVVSLRFDLFLSRLSLPFVHSLHLLYPGHHPPCGRNRRVLNPMRTRRTRSIAPWRYTSFSQVMRPTSSTTPTTQKLVQ